MLDTLPSEIIEQILGHLPTASSIINVALVDKKLHGLISVDNYGIFRNFIQKAFPSIRTPPQWRNMACILTSRSRAFDRRSFVVRECYPTQSEAVYLDRSAMQKFGYIPVIDSYENWSDSGTAAGKQVVAIGAGGRLRLRVSENGRMQWKSLRSPDDHLPQNDIVDVRLLRPHQHENSHGETIILRKANREITRVESGVGADNIVQTSRYLADGAYIDCMDLSSGADPLLAICSTKSLQLFPASKEDATRPVSVLPFAQTFTLKHRKRCMKFLDSHTLATAIQFVEGRERAPIYIYDITPSNITHSPLQAASRIEFDHPLQGRHCANVIVNLDDTSSLASRPGQVFLSGWSDGITRLHDRRSPSQIVRQFVDHVDDGQVLSLSVIGHEKFFAGSHQNACLKIFDMRMSNVRGYSYFNASQPIHDSSATAGSQSPKSQRYKRDINIFLAVGVQRNHLWAPLPPQTNRLAKYRGSVYSLSLPSPSSPTLFAGIENHILEFDFVNTDDILRKRSGQCDPAAGLSTLTTSEHVNSVLSLSCYERPREGHVATDPVLLRKQMEWGEIVRGVDESENGVAEEGWDQRWRLTESWKAKSRAKRWRHNNAG